MGAHGIRVGLWCEATAASLSSLNMPNMVTETELCCKAAAAVVAATQDRVGRTTKLSRLPAAARGSLADRHTDQTQTDTRAGIFCRCQLSTYYPIVDTRPTARAARCWVLVGILLLFCLCETVLCTRLLDHSDIRSVPADPSYVV